jgi:hypothetical protein
VDKLDQGIDTGEIITQCTIEISKLILSLTLYTNKGWRWFDEINFESFKRKRRKQSLLSLLFDIYNKLFKREVKFEVNVANSPE